MVFRGLVAGMQHNTGGDRLDYESDEQLEEFGNPG